MQVHVRKEQVLPVERNIVRHADVTYAAATARRVDGLHHRFLSANALEYRVRTDTSRQFLDTRDTFITSLSDNVGGTKLARELLARRDGSC